MSAVRRLWEKFSVKRSVSGEVIRNVISDEILKTIQIGITQVLFVEPIWQIIELSTFNQFYVPKRVNSLI